MFDTDDTPDKPKSGGIASDDSNGSTLITLVRVGTRKDEPANNNKPPIDERTTVTPLAKLPIWKRTQSPGPTMRPNIRSITGNHDIMVELAIEAKEPTDSKYGKDMIVAGNAEEKKIERSTELNNCEAEPKAKGKQVVESGIIELGAIKLEGAVGELSSAERKKDWADELLRKANATYARLPNEQEGPT